MARSSARPFGRVAEMHVLTLLLLLLLLLLLPPPPLAAAPATARSHRLEQCQRTHDRIERLRDLSSLGAPPASLGAAKQLHATLRQRVNQIEAIVGHTSAAPVLGQQGALLSQAPSPGDLITPEAFGGDPTGKTDSTAALLSCVGAVLARDRATAPMASGIRDLGGATIDLGGGTFNISAPLVFPELVGNFQIVRGTLRAGPGFPADKYLIEVGNHSCMPDNQKVCNEFINVNEIFLDASHVAAGGVIARNTMGLTVGPSAFVTGFNVAGVQVVGGHEIMITEAWFAEYYWSEHAPESSNSTGILLNAPDNILSNVIIFDYTTVGVVVNGGANVLEAVHSWNGGRGGVAVEVVGGPNRFIGCYMDWSVLHATDPQSLVVENTLFLNTHAVLAASGDSWKMDAEHVRFFDNTYSFYPGQQHYNKTSIELSGDFKKDRVVDVVVRDATDITWQKNETGLLKSTTATKTRTLSLCSTCAGSSLRFDFADELLFPWIDTVLYSVSTSGQSGPTLAAHSAATPVGTTVEVQFAPSAEAGVEVSVTMVVAQAASAL